MSDNTNTEEVHIQYSDPQEVEYSHSKGITNQRQLDDRWMSKLEADVEQIDKCLEDVILQMESVKQTRDEMFATTKKLQQNLEISGGREVDEEQKQKQNAVLSDISKREEIMKALETRELLLSHTMLRVISSWADEAERVLSSPLQQWQQETQHQAEVETKSTAEMHKISSKTEQ